MENNQYWEEYFRNYFNWMAMYLQDERDNHHPQYIYPNLIDYDFFHEGYDVADINDITPKISPEGGKFTIKNCKRMAIVKVVMRGNYKPSRFYLIVDNYDNKGIAGYRIVCEHDGDIRFRPMAIDYKDIKTLECAF